MENENVLRDLPSVDRLLAEKRVKQLTEDYSHQVVVDITRRHLDHLRLGLDQNSICPSFEQIADDVVFQINLLGETGPKRVINATGVILHTNLGRAPLSDDALAAMRNASEGYSNLEISLETGKRGSRQIHVERLVCQVTGAEDALVVNNNASAVLLALSAIAKRREVIVSRGQAVEIGGGFRIPDVMRQSGAKLVEIGTTNYSYPSDYENAVTTKTAALLRVHSSNFKVIGFSQEVSINELVEIGSKHDIPVIDDLGSGCLLDVTQFGLGEEPLVQASIDAGAGLALFSGDKLLGGPQAGIIAGKHSLIEILKKHPLARAVRIDKIRLAALSSTLLHYIKEEATDKIPIWRMIAASPEDIKERAEAWSRALGESATVIAGESTVGGGSLPGYTLPTSIVRISIPSNAKAQNLSHTLRMQPVPLIGRIEKNSLLLDPRSVLPEDDTLVVETLGNILRNL